MKGTNRKIFGKSGRNGAVLTLAGLFIMAMALAFTACEEEEESDPIASEFQGDYTGYKTSGTTTTVAVTVGADSIKVGDKTLTGVSTSGGGSDSGTESGVSYSSSWAYVMHEGDKVGIVYASTASVSGVEGIGRQLALGKTAAESALDEESAEVVVVSDVVNAGTDFDGYYTYNSLGL